MSNAYCGFIDAGYLRAQGSRACSIPGGQAQLQASACVSWLQATLPSQATCVAGLRFLRAYWYDGALEPQHAGYSEQHRIFDFHTAMLLAGDRDLAEPVRTAQYAGCRVVVATVGGQASLAKELAQLADEVIEIPPEKLKAMVTGPAREQM